MDSRSKCFTGDFVNSGMIKKRHQNVSKVVIIQIVSIVNMILVLKFAICLRIANMKQYLETARTMYEKVNISQFFNILVYSMYICILAFRWNLSLFYRTVCFI